MNLPLFAAHGAHPIATHAVAPVASFVIQHHPALWHAARILGGYEHARLVDRLVEVLHSDPCLRKRGRIMLEQLVELLALENVGDPERPEMGYFVAIDPADPVVEEICVLTDGLRAAIAQTQAPHRSTEQQAPARSDAA